MEEIKEILEEMESLLAATNLPMPPQFHLDQIKKLLPEKIQAIKNQLKDK